MKIDFDYLLQFVVNLLASYISDEKALLQSEEFVDDIRKLLGKWCA